MTQKTVIPPVSFDTFLNDFKSAIKRAFYEIDNIDKFTQQRIWPEPVLKEIMATKPLSVAIPSEYGGRGIIVKECLGMLEAAAYESLPLTLTLGINFALFMEPVAKYAPDAIKKKVFDKFLNHQNMGGLMITEPDFGSDALGMQTFNEKIGNDYRIKGTKHWQGLTGMADYWLMTSRAKTSSGELARDVDFMICENHNPSQHINVEEYYNNIGLFPIPYGLNNVDVTVPEENKLVPQSTGLKLMMDLLHRSRIQFPGMGIGFIKRMLDDALDHTQNRIVGGKSLFELDNIKYQISKLQSAFTVGSGLVSRSITCSSIKEDLSGMAVEANSMKAYITDLMQEAAQSTSQMMGGKGFKMETAASRGMMDTRPFQIFEGSNEMLYTQISELVLKVMGRKKIDNLFDYLKSYDLTSNISDYYKSLLTIKVDKTLSQRKLVDLGKIISRTVAANHVIKLADTGFRQDLIDNSIEMIKHEISALVGSFNGQTSVVPVVDYKENSSWLDLNS